MRFRDAAMAALKGPGRYALEQENERLRADVKRLRLGMDVVEEVATNLERRNPHDSNAVALRVVLASLAPERGK